MSENSLIDQALDECSQFRVLIVGQGRGKAQLLREIFGVNRVTRYPKDFSRDEEVYSEENEYFVAHVFESWEGVSEIVKRRKGELDDRIHCIWHYVDAQQAHDLYDHDQCPADVRKQVKVITIFARFDNLVTRAAEIGTKRRLREALTEEDASDAKQIRDLLEVISLYRMQYPSTTCILSKSSDSKLPLLRCMASLPPEIQLLLVIAQRLDPSWKFDTALRLAMKQFLLGTISTASPLPIPFAGLIGSSTATYMIKQDIIRIWNINDPDYLCADANGRSMMDTLMGIPQAGVKKLVYMIPVIAQINGIWETPRMARALGGLMIDLTLIMERAFIATKSDPLRPTVLKEIVADYAPIKQKVAEELEDYFDLENSGLKRSFQKDTVQRKLNDIVQRYRLT